MKKELVIAGGIVMVLGVLTGVVGLASAFSFDPEDSVLHDNTESPEFVYDGSALLIGVYAKGNVDCASVDVSINDDTYEYFERDCDSAWNTDSHTYLGEALISEAGTYRVESSSAIVLVNEDDIGTDGLVMICGGVCCFGGLVLLIVGLVMGPSGGPNQIMLVQQPVGLQQPVQSQNQFFTPPQTVQQSGYGGQASGLRPEALDYYQNLLHQGYDVDTALKHTKMYYPDWEVK